MYGCVNRISFYLELDYLVILTRVSYRVFGLCVCVCEPEREKGKLTTHTGADVMKLLKSPSETPRLLFATFSEVR